MSFYSEVDQERFQEPDMGEYYDEQLQQQILESIDGADGLTAAYYVDPPFSTNLGYYEEEACFVIKATPIIPSTAGTTGKEYDELHYNDGDTMAFYLDSIQDGGSFTIGSKEYSCFKEYAYKVLDSGSAMSGVFKVRFAGIDAPEIPHYEIISLSKDEEKDKVKKLYPKEFIGNSDYTYEVLKDRDENKQYTFVEVDDCWKEALCYGTKNPYVNAIQYDSCVRDNLEKDDVNYYRYVNTDKSTEKNIVDGKDMGILGKDVLRDALTNAEDIRIVLDQRQIYTGLNYSGLYDVLRRGVDEDTSAFEVLRRNIKINFGEEIWKYGGFTSTFGQDIYKRFLGAIYAKMKIDGNSVWVNLNKYVKAMTKGATELSVGLSATDIANGGHLSDAFNIWSYDETKGEYVDAFLDLSKEDRDDRAETQKEIIGCDYKDYMDYTVFIGDCLLMVPPTSIRLINQIDSQRVPLLRSKNTALKEIPNSNRMLQLTLYFNGDEGINGVKIRKQTPAQKGTDEYTYYYMNGLRALIAQFKFTPFLPIENTYINETLGIEAVSLISLDIETMPMYPKCLAVNLLLQEFNYRIYLNDLPVPDPTKGEKYNKNMFSASINYRVMRYYYQRAILAGESIKGYQPDSDEYIESTVGQNTNLIPMDFSDPSIKFLTANEAWLDKLKQTWIASKKQTVNQIEQINEQTAEWATFVGEAFAKILDYFGDGIEGVEDDYTGINYAELSIRMHKDLLENQDIPCLQNINFDGADIETVITFDTMNVTQAEINNLTKAVFKQLGLTSSNTSVSEMMKENTIMDGGVIKMPCTINRNTRIVTLKTDSVAYKLAKYFAARSNYTTSQTNIDYQNWFDFAASDNDSQLEEIKDQGVDTETSYTQKFFMYPMEDIVAVQFKVKMENTMSQTSLKAQPGFAPQYSGGQDTEVEFSFYTQNEATITMLNTMQDIAVKDLTTYKDVISCWPVRIISELTRLCGINEVIIESVDISTVPMQPGLYFVTCRAIGIDRTIRTRERLKRLDTNNSGAVNAQNMNSYIYKTYFDLNKELAKAELYPDLELPTLTELEQTGFKYIRYLNKTDRVYPDPDFYFVYAYAFSSSMLKKSIVEYFDKDDEGKSPISQCMTLLCDDSSENENIAVQSDDSDEVIDYSHFLDPVEAQRYKEIIAAQEEEIKADMSATSEETMTTRLQQEQIKEILKKYEEVSIQFLALYGPVWDVCKAIKVMFPDQNDKDQKQIVQAIEDKGKEISDVIKDYVFNNPINVSFSEDNFTSLETDFSSVVKKAAEQEYGDSYTTGLFNDVFSKINVKLSTIDSESSSLSGGNLTDRHDVAVADKQTIEDKKNYKNFRDDVIACYEAAAMALSANAEYAEKTDSTAYTAKEFLVSNPGRDYSLVTPYSKVVDENTGSIHYAKDMDDAIKNGTTFGTWQITIYDADYLNEFYKFDSYVFKSPGFLDLYYNNEYRINNGMDPLSTEEINAYKENCIKSARYCAAAFTRIIAIWTLKLINDQAYVTYYDCSRMEIMETIENLKEAIYNMQPELKDSNKKTRGRDKQIKDAELATEKTIISNIEDAEDTIVKTYEKTIAAGKIFLPIMCAVTDGGSKFYSKVLSHDISSLETMTRACQSEIYISKDMEDAERKFRKMIRAFAVTSPKLISDLSGIGSASTTALEEAMRDRDEKLWVNACQDPTLWVLHSFYDMIVTDKRGRMARAFPTYYMLFIDEGREIGYWKLHDNFYNMNSISEVEVVKSRKIAADTARIVMTNMFKTFDRNDEDIKTDYNNTLLDAWRSIFSPHIFYEQEELKRTNRMNIDRAVMKPGIRISLKIGYGSDASEIPTLFNGVITEATTGTVLEITAQSDAHEIVNTQAFRGVTATDAADLANESSPFKWIQNFFTEGQSPKHLIKNILTTKSGFLGSVIRQFTNGRFFNDNKFGVIHFGEIDYKEIHRDGEVMQNIYEAEGRMPWDQDSCDICSTSYRFSHQNPPKFTVELNGKSVWDILNICAGSALEFITAVAPFGIRSTIFFGRPHYYYAYDYAMRDDGYIMEKRKPYQQFHLIDSYSDIMYNNIHASANDVKTVAVPIYKGPNWRGAIIEKRCEPLYADWDIYPEFQKTEVVNTGMTFKNNKFGWFLFNKFLDEWDKNGGQKIAWRMGAKALKDSFKDMYTGDVCILGDPSIKPFDKVRIFDIYENMSGTFEVEAVVHTLSPQTGFTTDIYPDCISCVDSRYEQLGAMWSQRVFQQVIVAKGLIFAANHIFCTSTKPLLSGIARAITKGASGVTSFINKVGVYADKEELIKYSSLENWGEKFYAAVGISSKDLQLYDIVAKFKTFGGLVDDIDPKKIKTYTQLVEGIKKMQMSLNNLNYQAYATQIEQMKTDGYISEKYAASVDKVIDALKNSDDAITQSTQGITSLLKDVSDNVTSTLGNVADITPAQTKLIEAAKVYSESAETAEDAAKFIAALDEGSDVLGNIDETGDLIKTFTKVQDAVSDAANIGSKAAEAGNLAKAGGISSAISPKSILTSTLANIVIAVGLYILQKNIYNYIENKMASFNVLTVFPLWKDQAVMVAGIDGHKGLVVGSPSWEEKGLVDGFITWAFESHGMLYDIFVKGLLFSENMNKIAETYKTDNKLGYAGALDEQSISGMLESIGNSQAETTSYYRSLKYATRITAANTVNANVTFDQDKIWEDLYSIPHCKELEDNFVTISPDDKNLEVYIDNKMNVLLDVWHYTLDISGRSDIQGKTTFKFDNINGTTDGAVIPGIMLDSSRVDLPMLRGDAYQVLLRILSKLNDKYESEQYDDTEEKKTLMFCSGTITNDNTWATTGYMFRIDSNNISITDLKNVFDEIQEELNSEKVQVVQFMQVISGRSGRCYDVFVLPRDKSFQYVSTTGDDTVEGVNGSSSSEDTDTIYFAG